VSVAGGYVAVTPSRILDTRIGTGAAKAPVAANGVLSLQVTGAGGVPVSGVSAVVLNVAVTAPTADGWIAVYPAGSGYPGVANLNFVAGQTIPNLVVVQLGTGGAVNLKNGSAGTVQLVADVSGYFTAGTPSAPGTFQSLTPARILDTRNGTGAANAAVGAKQAVSLQVTGAGGVPSAGVSAVVLNLADTAPTADGWIAVYPGNTSYPGVANLNFSKGQTVPNLVVVPVGNNGRVELLNGSAGTVQIGRAHV
jgi:hypothetical protein